MPLLQRNAPNPTIDYFAWNPRRCGHLPPQLRYRIPVGRRVNNFGDLLGPLIVGGMVEKLGLESPVGSRVLASVGSVMHLLESGTVVWGTGVNGKVPIDRFVARSFDIRALRGPRSRAQLAAWGVDVPSDVPFGDPALLLAQIRPDLTGLPAERDHLVVPNFNDDFDPGPDVLDPTAPLEHCLRAIATSRLVVGSSLHGVIVAEALGIPARLVRAEAEPAFKYDDYYSSTGRAEYETAASHEIALKLGGERPPDWDPEPLVAAFPTDLWVERGSS